MLELARLQESRGAIGRSRSDAAEARSDGLGERGGVARIVESVPWLNQSVIDAVKQWQFDAATVNGAGDPILITVTAKFAPPR